MHELQLLGVALGLATLAGINLYLTVLVTGVAIRMDWLSLAGPYHDLAVLGDPVIIGIAGAMFFIEFFADKIPWVDTAWDGVHTFIRPIGAVALALTALGDVNPVFEVAAVLIAGGMALTSHTAKAGTRLVANSSPEPVSNIGLSLFEDGIVVGGLALIAWNPLVALIIAVAFTAAVIFFLPPLLRAIRTKLFLAWCKLNAPIGEDVEIELGNHLPGGIEKILRRSHSGDSAVEWAVPVISGGGPRLRSNIRGWLVTLEGEAGRIFFVSKRWAGGVSMEIDTKEARFEHKPGFLADKLEVHPSDGAKRYTFLFERGRSAVAQRLSQLLATPARELISETASQD